MGESERFRIDCGVRQGYVMFSSLFNAYMDAVMKEVKMGMGRRGMKFLEDERLSGLLYVDGLVVC